MARITGLDAIKDVMDKYSSSSADFFTLKDDGESAKVRFCHGDDKDLDIYVVHKVSLAGKDRYIECRSNGGICPFCKAGLRPQVRIFVTLEDGRDGKRKLWDRGKTDIPNFLGLTGRYGRLDNREYEIVRHGKKGDSKTTYQFFPLDPITIELAPREKICTPTGFILEKTEEEMVQLLNEVGEPSQNPQYASQPQQQQQQQASRGKMF